MQLSCCQDNVLSCLLLEGLHARIRLTEQLQAPYEFRHVSGVLGLQCNTDNRRCLYIRDPMSASISTARLQTYVADDPSHIDETVFEL